ncbi:uncharacterized protein nol7 [Menidia menidia]
MTYVIPVNMAKKQRGKTRSSAGKTDSEKQGKHFAMAFESSDEEAPEEVTFEDSKVQALRSMKHALDTAKREREELKEKRRRRQELFQEQKKRKLLSADVLAEIDPTPSKKLKESDGEGKEAPAEEEQQEEEEGGAQEAPRRRRGARKKKTSGKGQHARTLKGNYRVATLRAAAAACFQQQAAEEFLHSRLYGPGSCRTTSVELLSLEKKKGANQSAAVRFVKKDWGCKQKAKAEKLNRRWIHKQKLPSS